MGRGDVIGAFALNDDAVFDQEVGAVFPDDRAAVVDRERHLSLRLNPPAA